MSIFGRTDRDLHLLRLNADELKAARFSDVEDQLKHHCLRLAWREHARTGACPRELAEAIAGAAYIRLYEAVPDDEFDAELLSQKIEDVRRANELWVCFGFMLVEECRILCLAAVDGPFPPPGSIFENRFGMLIPYLPERNSRLRLARAALLKLRDQLEEYRRRVATDSRVRETVRIVASVTGKDPHLLDSCVLNGRLRLLETWIEEFEPDLS